AEVTRFISMELLPLDQNPEAVLRDPGFRPYCSALVQLRVERKDDRFAIIDPPLPPGQYQLHAELGDTVLLPITQVISVPQQGKVRVPLHGQPGARIQIDLINPTTPGHYNVVWRVKDPGGKLLHEQSQFMDIGRNASHGFGMGSSFMEPVVPSGRCALEVEVNGVIQLQETLDVDAGRTTRRLVFLET
ncbi:MAG: hypothetical protein KDB53_07885, partial [Planctomycetes bacterium]|nr:hypothetical protein [Planctomycetota bacterium]